MKDVLVAAGLPTAAHRSFGADELDAAVAYLRTLPGLYVVKTDGLAAGKGVLVTDSLTEAEDDVRAKLSGASFGEAGRRVVIEEGMTGPEVSLLCLCDGRRAVPLASAQDYKRLGDGDDGPEHRRHGCVLAGAGRRCRGSRAPDGAARRPHAARAATAGHRLPRRALRRADADAGRSEGARVQRAVRRSRDPGRAAPLDGRRDSDAGGLRDRIVEHATNVLERCRGDGRVCVRGLPAGAADRRPSSRDWTRRRPDRGSTCSAPAWPRATTGRS